jgi:hypothetical protein
MHENPSAGKFDRPSDLERKFEPPPDPEAARTRRRRTLALVALLIVTSWPVRDWLFSLGGGLWTVVVATTVLACVVLNFVIQRRHDEDLQPNLPYTDHHNITR